MSKASKREVSPSSIEEQSQSRIITKNLVYVIGLSQKVATKETLIKYEYFGQYGKITKIVINKKKAYNQNNPYGPSFSAYVTYSKPSEASIAILALDNTIVDNHLIRASFGTTKYCAFYLKKVECTKKDCLFLHHKASESDIIKREDLNVNKNIFYEQQLYAIKIADIYNIEIKKKLIATGRGKKTVFPSTDEIYKNEIVMENDPILMKKYNQTKKVFTEDTNGNSGASSKNSSVSNANKKLVTRNPNPTLKLKIEEIKSRSDDVTCCSSTGDEKLSPKKESRISYECKKASRFDFVNEDDKIKSEAGVPEYVLELINKRYKIEKYGKYFKNLDLMLLKGEIGGSKQKQKDDWTQFIVKNSNPTHTQNEKKQNKDEYINDFDNINHFILTKINCK